MTPLQNTEHMDRPLFGKIFGINRYFLTIQKASPFFTRSPWATRITRPWATASTALPEAALKSSPRWGFFGFLFKNLRKT